MRTVSYIWRQERQKRNVLEIARQSGMLYDKFVGFVEDLREVGQPPRPCPGRFERGHEQALRIQKIRRYPDRKGAENQGIGRKASKSLPADLLNEEPDLNEEELALL